MAESRGCAVGAGAVIAFKLLTFNQVSMIARNTSSGCKTQPSKFERNLALVFKNASIQFDFIETNTNLIINSFSPSNLSNLATATDAGVVTRALKDFFESLSIERITEALRGRPPAAAKVEVWAFDDDDDQDQENYRGFKDSISSSSRSYSTGNNKVKSTKNSFDLSSAVSPVLSTHEAFRGCFAMDVSVLRRDIELSAGQESIAYESDMGTSVSTIENLQALVDDYGNPCRPPLHLIVAQEAQRRRPDAKNPLRQGNIVYVHRIVSMNSQDVMGSVVLLGNRGLSKNSVEVIKESHMAFAPVPVENSRVETPYSLPSEKPPTPQSSPEQQMGKSSDVLVPAAIGENMV